MRYDDERMNEFFRRGASSNANKGAIYQHPEIITRALTDKEGLDRAYARDDKLYVNGDTMYVAGTSYWQDVYDWRTIPFGNTAQAQRYKDADALLANNQQVKNLVGHSLGGASVLELQKNHGERTFKTNTYAAPTASITTPDNKDNHRYRNYGDIVSIFDRGAESRVKPDALAHYGIAAAEAYTTGIVNPKEIVDGVLSAHTYKNFNKTKISNEDYHEQPIF